MIPFVVFAHEAAILIAVAIIAGIGLPNGMTQLVNTYKDRIPLLLAIAGSGLYVGRHEGEPLTADLPGAAPHAFTGGTINRVAIDVSGDAYLDLEREAELMLMRE